METKSKDKSRKKNIGDNNGLVSPEMNISSSFFSKNSKRKSYIMNINAFISSEENVTIYQEKRIY